MLKALTQMKMRVLVASHYKRRFVTSKATRSTSCASNQYTNKSGYELCEVIRGPMALTRVPIIATSECGTSHDMAHAEVARANAFLLKPFAMRELADCVRSLLDRTSGRLPLRHALALRYEPLDSLVA